LTEVDLLKRQVDILEKQLNQALLRENQSLERESFYQEQIEAMQRLLEAPKPHIPTSIDPEPTQAEQMTEEKEEVITMPQKEPENENKPFQSILNQSRKGAFEPFFCRMINHD
jgi:hypothetical protein